MIKRVIVSCAALVLGTCLAIADDAHKHTEGDGHAHAQEEGAKHGGVVQHSGHHHVELVAKGGNVELYVSNEDGKAEDLNGAKASATVLADGKTERITLEPSGANSFKGSGGFNAGKGTTVVVSLTMPGHDTEQIRFKID